MKESEASFVSPTSEVCKIARFLKISVLKIDTEQDIIYISYIGEIMIKKNINNIIIITIKSYSKRACEDGLLGSHLL
ncbi:hypothetical protein BpHYR1_030958 [Brachionus plicatilis]|uniref:Uncharacterized protein n=1 Tax=Brachionus plicatilis TaxID=10195 RepID=A0A3M7SVT1_BRAPC|nr:hypothetical protein BpHYR1_030958 [Brachionus plicatilis]